MEKRNNEEKKKNLANLHNTRNSIYRFNEIKQRTDSRILNVSICVCKKLIVYIFDSGTCGVVVALAHYFAHCSLSLCMYLRRNKWISVSRGSNGVVCMLCEWVSHWAISKCKLTSVCTFWLYNHSMWMSQTCVSFRLHGEPPVCTIHPYVGNSKRNEK